MQLTYVLDWRLKELSEDAEREKALKEVAAATAKEKVKAIEVAEKKAATTKKARVFAKKRSTKLEMKLGATELKLAEAESLNLIQVDELADLKATPKTCENKWYNEGFADTENLAEPIVCQARGLGFEEGWLAALQAMGIPEDSLLRNLDQIPFLDPSPAIQSPSGTIDEEETPNMRELVRAIDSYVELVDLEVTSNLYAGDQPDENVQLQPPPSAQPTEDVIEQPSEDAALLQPTDPLT